MSKRQGRHIVNLGKSLVGALLIAVGVYAANLTISADVADKAMPSVVLVKATVEETPSLFDLIFGRYNPKETKAPELPKIIHYYAGTAFVVSGHLITAAHVVVPESKDGKTLSISITSPNGHKASAKIARVDKASDLAELDYDGPELPSLTLSSAPPARGDKVIQIGNPALILFVISRGTIVGFDQEQGYNIATIDTFGGNSGGPILNAGGKVIGVCHTLIGGSRFTGIGTLEALRDFLSPNELR